MATIKRNI